MTHNNLRARKEGQVWVSDYTMSLLLFILAAIIAIKIIVNSFATNTAFTELKADTVKISEMLLSEGVPVDWSNESNVLRPGLLTGERLDPGKVYNASLMNYTKLRPKLQTRYEFLVIFKNKNNAIINFSNSTGSDTNCVIGSPEVDTTDCYQLDFSSIDYDNLVKLTRLVIYNSSIVKMEVYTWNK